MSIETEELLVTLASLDTTRELEVKRLEVSEIETLIWFSNICCSYLSMSIFARLVMDCERRPDLLFLITLWKRCKNSVCAYAVEQTAAKLIFPIVQEYKNASRTY